MDIKFNKKVEQVVRPRFLDINLKVCDEFAATLLTNDEVTIKEQDDGYVPSFMPGGGGDYVELRIDVTTGQVVNWDTLRFQREVVSWLEGEDD